ncbi:MAG: M2 family metallopeptidase [bacterium]
MKSILFIAPFLALLLISCSGGSSMDTAARQFVDKHTQIVEPLMKAQALASWNANATGEKKFYTENAALDVEISKVYSNKNEFQQIKTWLEGKEIKDSLLLRQLTILHNKYLTKQLDTTLMKQIADKEAVIAEKFNTFRPKLDGKEVSDNVINEILKTETNSAKRQKAWEASKEVGLAVAPMVIELAKLRNQAAQQLGFENYYVMSLVANEQSERELVAIFDELKQVTDEAFKKLKTDIDGNLTKKYGIKTDQVMPWHYQDRFFQEAPTIGTVDLDKYFKGKKVDQVDEVFYKGIGMEVQEINKNSDLYERKGKYQHAFCSDIDRKGDIRMMLSISDNHYWAATMLHELGHAVYSKYTRSDLPFFLRDASHAFLTEAIAQLMERQASNADWLEAMVGVSAKEKEEIRKVTVENLRLRQLIFCRWSQVMLRFERAMYQNPDEDLNKMWWDLVEEYQLVKRAPGRNAPDWAAKIHLAQYPVYYHNYMLGELAASQIQHTIVKNVLKLDAPGQASFAGKPEVGNYLKEKVLSPGTTLRWDGLLKYATGETLTAKYFAEEFVGK